ncbi:response regulator transcription factor [Mucilaginibacter flavus]|uniref:response regulator transcription factor n=1 Tax=Mucilaginibacter flavus TaxID=931504 RepID=UPI0025B5E415|nr:LuxR C-terminal-related transcriptional regulator [Mucilaginibacter flavus]MDN3579762.1 LuxR C-terminal-related transcriptional regulator [Mucilaginibacter flavus]
MYGASLAVMLFLMRWLEYRFIIIDNSLEIYIGAIAIIFTSLGVWLALKLSSPKVKTIHVEKEVYVYSNEGFVLDETILTRLNISRRELEVLQLMAEGLSNQEIAGRLFVSLNTIKTHSSNIFGKLEVDRRTQAVDKAKKLNLIA